jgi:hypothetical protein
MRIFINNKNDKRLIRRSPTGELYVKYIPPEGGPGSSSPDCDLVITEGDFTIQNIIQTHNNDNLITHTGSYIITRS